MRISANAIQAFTAVVCVFFACLFFVKGSYNLAAVMVTLMVISSWFAKDPVASAEELGNEIVAKLKDNVKL